MNQFHRILLHVADVVSRVLAGRNGFLGSFMTYITSKSMGKLIRKLDALEDGYLKQSDKKVRQLDDHNLKLL